MTQKTLIRIGILLCLIFFLAVPQLAAASNQSTVVSLPVSEVVIDVDDEIRDLGYTVNGKENVRSIFTITGGRVVVSLNEVPVWKIFHASILGGTLILGDNYTVVIPLEDNTVVSLSLTYADKRNGKKYAVPNLQFITESRDGISLKLVQNIFADMMDNRTIWKNLSRLDNV